MEIDIRENHNVNRIEIRFGDYEFVTRAIRLGPDLNKEGVTICDESEGQEVTIYQEDIDNLIKALKKAKELWT